MSSITRRTEQVVIYQGDDAALIEVAANEFNRVAQQEPPIARRLADGSPLQEAAEAYDAAKAAALERAVTATVQALGRKAYRTLKAAHPPREDNEEDQALGFHGVTFLDAILEHYDLETGEKSVIEPAFGSRQAYMDWLDNLNDGNFEQLATAAVRVNEGGSPDPKVVLGSQVARLFGGTSPSPASTD